MLHKIKAWRPSLSPLQKRIAGTPTGRYLAKFTPDFYLWTFAALIFALAVVFLLAKIFLAGSVLSSQAMETGQRVLIHVASGEVEGNAPHTKRVEAAPASVPADAPVPKKDGLAPAPLQSISAQTDKGLVPTVGKDGTLPWKYYARPYKPAAARPMVAVVLTQLGLSESRTTDALTLPRDVTLSFSPYAADAHKWAAAARDAGFETLVDLPMQSADYRITGADPGPYGLLQDLSAEETAKRLNWALSRFPGFTGALAPDDESLTADLAGFRPTLAELAHHGVLFLYVKTPKNAELGIPENARAFNALGIDKIVDEDIEPEPIAARLDGLTALAKTQGYAIGFAHPYPPTLAALAQWADALKAQGVDLVPVSAIAMKAFP